MISIVNKKIVFVRKIDNETWLIKTPFRAWAGYAGGTLSENIQDYINN